MATLDIKQISKNKGKDSVNSIQIVTFSLNNSIYLGQCIVYRYNPNRENPQIDPAYIPYTELFADFNQENLMQKCKNWVNGIIEYEIDEYIEAS